MQGPALQRLRTRAQFQAVMAGRTVSRTPHFVLHRCELPHAAVADGVAAVVDAPASTDLSTGPESRRPQALFSVHAPWIGAVVPKRWARRAVTRNAIKRQIYAVAQEFASRLPSAAHVVRLRSGFERKQFPSATSEPLKRAVRAELQQLLGGIRA